MRPINPRCGDSEWNEYCREEDDYPTGVRLEHVDLTKFYDDPANFEAWQREQRRKESEEEHYA